MKKIYFTFTICFMLILSVSKGMAENNDTFIFNGPSFKAKMKVSNRNNPVMSSTAKVWMSKHGLRMDAPGPGGKNMITLTTKDETYMLLPSQRKYISSTDIEQQADKTSEEESGGLFADKPCQGFAKSKKANTTKVGGRKVTKWYCGKSQGLDNTVHFFDEDLELVTKVAQPDGTVMELTNIKEKPLDKKLFEIPKGYEKMTFAQMMMPPGMNLEPFAGEK